MNDFRKTVTHKRHYSTSLPQIEHYPSFFSPNKNSESVSKDTQSLKILAQVILGTQVQEVKTKMEKMQDSMRYSQQWQVHAHDPNSITLVPQQNFQPVCRETIYKFSSPNYRPDHYQNGKEITRSCDVNQMRQCLIDAGYQIPQTSQDRIKIIKSLSQTTYKHLKKPENPIDFNINRARSITEQTNPFTVKQTEFEQQRRRSATETEPAKQVSFNFNKRSRSFFKLNDIGNIKQILVKKYGLYSKKRPHQIQVPQQELQPRLSRAEQIPELKLAASISVSSNDRSDDGQNIVVNNELIDFKHFKQNLRMPKWSKVNKSESIHLQQSQVKQVGTKQFEPQISNLGLQIADQYPSVQFRSTQKFMHLEL